ncbi:MAG: hypothetical protein ABW136_01710 [Steroidobacteraceae bacterium]
MRLVLTVSDCPLPAGAGEPGDRGPDLAALSLMLSRGRSAADRVPWQLRLGALLAPGVPQTPASLAAASLASGSVPPREAWFAQPVALHAATDHLRLPKGGLLQLSTDEAELLVQDFVRVFGGDGLTLHPLAQGGLLLAGLSGSDGAVEPSRVQGGRIDAATRAGDARVRRLASELELWLHEHPVNARRARRGAPPVMGLWLWGGGEPRALPASPVGTVAFIAGSDPVVIGAAKLAGRPVSAVPESFDELLPELAGDATAVVQVSASEGLARVESAWLAPALARLRRARLDGLRLLILDADVELTAARSWQVWRRVRPWWDTLSR